MLLTWAKIFYINAKPIRRLQGLNIVFIRSCFCNFFSYVGSYSIAFLLQRRQGECWQVICYFTGYAQLPYRSVMSTDFSRCLILIISIPVVPNDAHATSVWMWEYLCISIQAAIEQMVLSFPEYNLHSMIKNISDKVYETHAFWCDKQLNAIYRISQTHPDQQFTSTKSNLPKLLHEPKWA